MAANDPKGLINYDRGVAAIAYHIAIMVGCTGRLAHAILIGLSLLFSSIVSALITNFTFELRPEKGKSFIQLLIASFGSALAYVVASFITPAISAELELYYLLMPASLIASGLLGRHPQGKAASGAAVAATIVSVFREIGLVAAFVAVLALFREPLGYGTVSLPGRDGLFIILTSGVEYGGLKLISSSAGGFIIFGYIFAAARGLRSRLYHDDSRRWPL